MARAHSQASISARKLWPRLPLLGSFAFLQTQKHLNATLLACAPYIQWLVDSGAFTNFAIKKFGSKHKPVLMRDYIAACRDHYDRAAWQYIQLDMIRQPADSWRNLQTMRDAGLRPMPVYVENDTVDHVPRLLEASRTNHICVAGGVHTNDRYAYARYQHAYKASGARAKIHALGFLRYPDIFQLPLYSGDSSSNVRGQRFGSVMMFDPYLGILTPHWFDLHQITDIRQQLIVDYLRACRVPDDLMSQRAGYHGQDSIASLTSAYAFLRLQAFAYTRGVRVFAVFISDSHFNSLAALLRHAQAETFDYPATVARCVELRAIRKAHGFDRWLQEIVAAFQNYTNWETSDERSS